MKAALLAKMRLLAHIVVEHQGRDHANDSPKVAESCNFIRLGQAGVILLIDLLCSEGYVTKDTQTGLLIPTGKGIGEARRYLRIFEQKI